MKNYNYEEKMKALSECRPENKDLLLMRILRGERSVPITGDEDLFYSVNRDRVSMEEFTERDKFKHAEKEVKQFKQNLHDPMYGRTKNKKLRLLGEIPAEIYFSRKEFSPTLDKKERDANIRKWLNKYHTFRMGDKQV